VTTAPSGAVDGVVFTGQPVIELRDAGGLRMASATNLVTASVSAGSGVLAGTASVAAVGGLATFTNLKINGTGSHTLQFAAAGLGGSTSATLNVGAGSSIVRLNVGGAAAQNVQAGQNVSVPMTLDMSSAGGRNVASLSFNVTWDAAKFQFVSGAANNGSGLTVFPNEGSAGAGSIAVAAFGASGITASATIYTVTLKAIAAAGSSGSVSAGSFVAGDELAVAVAVTARNLTLTIIP